MTRRAGNRAGGRRPRGSAGSGREAGVGAAAGQLAVQGGIDSGRRAGELGSLVNGEDGDDQRVGLDRLRVKRSDGNVHADSLGIGGLHCPILA